MFRKVGAKSVFMIHSVSSPSKFRPPAPLMLLITDVSAAAAVAAAGVAAAGVVVVAAAAAAAAICTLSGRARSTRRRWPQASCCGRTSLQRLHSPQLYDVLTLCCP